MPILFSQWLNFYYSRYIKNYTAGLLCQVKICAVPGSVGLFVDKQFSAEYFVSDKSENRINPQESREQ